MSAALEVTRPLYQALIRKNNPHRIPEDPFAPAAAAGLSEIGRRWMTPPPGCSLSPSMPLLCSLAGPAGNGSQGPQQCKSHPNPALRALESERELRPFGLARSELSREIREASVPFHHLHASNTPSTVDALPSLFSPFIKVGDTILQVKKCKA